MTETASARSSYPGHGTSAEAENIDDPQRWKQNSPEERRNSSNSDAERQAPPPPSIPSQSAQSSHQGHEASAEAENINDPQRWEQNSPEERRNSSNSDVERQAPLPPSIPSQAPPKRSTKLRQLLLVIITLSVTGPLAIFSFYYLYEALVSDNPRLGRLFLSPSRTLNLVSILTHSLATLLPIIIIQLFDIIRWPLLWRDNGILAPKFLALGAATSLWGLLTLGFMRGTHLLWTWQRYI